ARESLLLEAEDGGPLHKVVGVGFCSLGHGAAIELRSMVATGDVEERGQPLSVVGREVEADAARGRKSVPDVLVVAERTRVEPCALASAFQDPMEVGEHCAHRF